MRNEVFEAKRPLLKQKAPTAFAGVKTRPQL
jgi:hypothetical protein